jgi:uncharacterized membrane protein
MEAFSDGVIAILITIMVLELKVPQGATLQALAPLVPTLLCYALSFVFLGIYWNNHHHLLQAVKHVNGAILWANMHLLFWLSLVPFVTAWMGQNHFEAWPTAAYGIVLLMCAVSFTLLVSTLIAADHDSPLAKAIGSDFKGKVSLALYLAAPPLAFASAPASLAIYVTVALIWLVPDRRIEKALKAP